MLTVASQLPGYQRLVWHEELRGISCVSTSVSATWPLDFYLRRRVGLRCLTLSWSGVVVHTPHLLLLHGAPEWKCIDLLLPRIILRGFSHCQGILPSQDLLIHQHGSGEYGQGERNHSKIPFLP